MKIKKKKIIKHLTNKGNLRQFKGKNTSDNVELRRQEFIKLLGSGLELKQIAVILNVSIDTLYKDKQEISRRGLDNLRNLGNAELTFYFASLISDMNENKRFLWNIINSDTLTNQSGIKNSDNDNTQIISIDHKLKASRTLMEIDREFRELYKDTVNAVIIPDYTKRLEQIENRLLNEDNTNIDSNKDNKIKSFMNLKRPSLIKDYNHNNNNSINNNDNDIDNRQ